MFDAVKIVIKAGNGGDGVVSFRHEKYVPFGGPDGGDGGGGGDVIIVADPGTSDLRGFMMNRVYRAGHGKNGKGKNKHGRRGEGLVLKVPVGTIALMRGQTGCEELIADFERSGQRVVIAKGGKGGLGNIHFASSTNQAPRIAQKGEEGEEWSILLELRLIADVGIVGYPNVGKSTLLAAASAAKPKIASYPFTTLEPVLGTVEDGVNSFVWAEIPGLIDGAHLGRGLGHDFLRHIVRTKMIVHLIDGSSASPVENMVRVNEEISLFDAALAEKPQLVAVNKVDLPQVRARLAEVGSAFNEAGVPVLFVSAVTGEGVDKLVAEIARMLSILATQVKVGKKVPAAVFRPQPRHVDASVHKQGDTFVITAPELERIVARVDMNDAEVRRQLQGQLARLGISKALGKAGIKPGDRVRCGGSEWVW